MKQNPGMLVRLNPDVKHLVALDSEGSKEYGELALIDGRLEQIQEVVGQLRLMNPKKNFLFGPLWWFCINTYPRCFGHSGNHQGYALNRDTIFGHLPGALESHEYFCTIRSKHVSHAVNQMEKAETIAMFAPIVQRNVYMIS